MVKMINVMLWMILFKWAKDTSKQFTKDNIYKVNKCAKKKKVNEVEGICTEMNIPLQHIVIWL